MLSINTNISSLIAQNSMSSATQLLNQAVERMTTGYKINHSKDNAANYSISTNMTTKINSYMVAEDNCAMGLDMLATANGSLDQISDKLTRLRGLQTQASNGTYGSQSLNAINAEANALVDEINRLYSTVEYNGINLFGDIQVAPTALVSPQSTVVYEQYSDDYIIGYVPDSPESYLKFSFSDGTVLSSFTAIGTSYPVTWGDLSVPAEYTWSEEKGCFLNSLGEEQALKIEKHVAEIGATTTEDLTIYGIETIVAAPTPAPGSGSGSSNTIYSPDSINLQVGINSELMSQIEFSTKFSLTGVEELRNIGIDTTTDYLTTLDNMLSTVNAKQTEFGAIENRLTSALDEISIQYENLVSSRSTIRDADIAEVSSEYIRQQILQQASATLMATANQSPSIALQLI